MLFSIKRNYKNMSLKMLAQMCVYFQPVEREFKRVLPLPLASTDSWQINQNVKWDQIHSLHSLTLIFNFPSLRCSYIAESELESIDLGTQPVRSSTRNIWTLSNHWCKGSKISHCSSNLTLVLRKLLQLCQDSS